MSNTKKKEAAEKVASTLVHLFYNLPLLPPNFIPDKTFVSNE